MEVVEYIRQDENCGICSNIWMTIEAVSHAVLHNQLPIINFKDRFYSQFHDKETVHKHNIWEDYFKQPFSLRCEDVSNFFHEVTVYTQYSDFDKLNYETQKDICNRVLNLSSELKQEIDSIKPFYYNPNTLGVLIRGTDYKGQQPHGHPRQPTIEQVIETINSIKKDKDIDGIFLVTDEYQYKDRIEHDTNLHVYHHQHSFINYIEGCFNYDLMRNMCYSDKKNLNLQYLASVIILSRMDKVLLSNTSALNVYKYLRIANNIQPSVEITMNLGVYQ